MTDNADIVGNRDAPVAPRDRLDGLVIGRDAGPNQAIGDRQAVDDVDRDVAGLLQRLGRIIARRTRPADRDMTHQPISISGACPGTAVPFVVDASLTVYFERRQAERSDGKTCFGMCRSRW